MNTGEYLLIAELAITMEIVISTTANLGWLKI